MKDLVGTFMGLEEEFCRVNRYENTGRVKNREIYVINDIVYTKGVGHVFRCKRRIGNGG